MKWLLDTNACIRYLNGRSQKLRDKLDTINPSNVCISSVVKAELFFGAERSLDPVKTRAIQNLFLSRFSSLVFDDAAAEEYARIKAELTKQGLLIGPNDLMIAATCKAEDVTLVTHNISEFSRVADLKIEDWEA